LLADGAFLLSLEPHGTQRTEGGVAQEAHVVDVVTTRLVADMAVHDSDLRLVLFDCLPVFACIAQLNHKTRSFFR
jgi:hypothetical protein